LVGEISHETLLDVFHDWIAWCESMIASDRNYFEHTIICWYLFGRIQLSGEGATLRAEHPVLILR
jgi:hypothetical protein